MDERLRAPLGFGPLQYPNTIGRMFYGQRSPPLYRDMPEGGGSPPAMPPPTFTAQQLQSLLRGGLRQQMPQYLPQLPGPPPIDDPTMPAMDLKQAGRMYQQAPAQMLRNPWFQYSEEF